MSRAAEDLARAQRCPTPVARLVLLNLAWHHNADTGACFPSYERIADEENIGRSSVARAIKELAAAGLIAISKGRRRGSHNGSNRYVLVFMHQGAIDALGQTTRAHAYRSLNDSPKVGREQGNPSSNLRSEEGNARAKTSKRRTQRRAPATRIPDEWQPTPRQRDFVVQLGIPSDRVQWIADYFRDWWKGNGGVKADWGATWYNWCRTELKRASENEERQANGRTGPGAGGFNGRPPPVDMVAAYRRAFGGPGDGHESGGDEDRG